ncbi:hypothetical protein BZL29_1768 [Mycobacterium kansasii]|uniref:Uncharacterized protein n=1 Tax=Mycobacterium kansasii TaxID=1768 RepID=A0A1V3XN72_MYCKA|nr:hypothetical protein BZL29_1768 [Mycobacterium kansasii]
MASARKSQWKTFQRFTENLGNLVFNEAPKAVRQLQNSQAVLQELQRAVKITANIMAMGLPPPPQEIAAGRPVTSTSFPTAQRARRLVYALTSMAGPARGNRVDVGGLRRRPDPRQGPAGACRRP